jgi:outer membrane receptor protein involved in Fe transport
MSLPARLGVLILALLSFHHASGAETSWKGASLREYIASLLEQGVRIIYSTDLVRNDYTVLEEPTSPDPAMALRGALSPYGLTAADGPAGSLLIIIDDRAVATLTVSVAEAGRGQAVPSARVLIDGAPVGRTDMSGELSVAGITPGDHELVAVAEGYLDSTTVPFTATAPGPPVDVGVILTRRPQPLTEIIVTSSLYNLRYGPPASHTYLDRDLTTKLPDLGEEAMRSLTRVPGAASGGISTRTHVRGGIQNEQLFLLDGLRLYEPYHMKDFHEVATIVDQGAIAGIDFYSAGYPARYGDRMSGVVDISLRQPPDEMQTELGLSFFNTSALSLGRFGGGDRGDWIVSARRGNLDLLADVVNPEYGAPRYSDLLLHAGWELGERTYLSANSLFSYDKISISEIDDSVHANAKYQNNILWIKAKTSWTGDLDSTTILSATEIDNSRQGTSEQPGVLAGMVDDARTFRSLALKQDWEYSLSRAWVVRSGFEVKRLEAAYSYASTFFIAAPFDRALDNAPMEIRNIHIAPRGSQYALYAEARWQATDRLIIDAGLRWDQQTYTTAQGDAQTSPRLSVLYELGPATELRVGFGEFYQAQEINELQVADGVTDFHGAQHAQHLVAGLEHEFEAGFDLRLELYQKKYRDLMPRYENIFDGLVLIPELQIDRARIDAGSAIAEGAEITLSADRSDDLFWWVSYTWSRADDIEGGSNIPRSWDQTHTLNAGLSWDWRKWTFSAAGIVHTGWPKSELVAETVINPDNTPGLVVSSVHRNSLRHGEFQTLDVRISRTFDVGMGELTAFVEVTNLYNHENPCCTEYSIATDEDGTLAIISSESNWLPMVPSLGVVWRF